MADHHIPEETGPDTPASPTEPLAVSTPVNAEQPSSAAEPAAASPTIAQPATAGAEAVAEPATPAPATGAAGVWRAIDRGPQGKPWRVLSIVLLVIGCVLAPIGVTASWAKNLVVDQDAYLEAVAPLITDPAIVSAAETRLVAGIDDAITNLQLADKIGTELQSLGLPPKLASLATTYLATFRADVTTAITKMVDELLQSPKLATIWDNANATLHTKFVQVMHGESPGTLHTLNVDLSAAVAEVKQKLEATGVEWAANIPDVPVVIDIAGNANVQRVAGYYDLLVGIGDWVPIVAILLLLISILIAPSRLGGLSKAAGWLAVSMVVLALVLIIGRQWLISKSPLQPDVTQAFTRQLTVNLQDTVRFIVVVGAVISVAAWLFGRSKSAVGLRGEVHGLVGRVRDSRWHLAVRAIAAIVAIALVLVLLNLENPSVLWAVFLALLAGLAAVVAVSPQRATASVDGGSIDGDPPVDNRPAEHAVV